MSTSQPEPSSNKLLLEEKKSLVEDLLRVDFKVEADIYFGEGPGRLRAMTVLKVPTAWGVVMVKLTARWREGDPEVRVVASSPTLEDGAAIPASWYLGSRAVCGGMTGHPPRGVGSFDEVLEWLEGGWTSLPPVLDDVIWKGKQQRRPIERFERVSYLRGLARARLLEFVPSDEGAIENVRAAMAKNGTRLHLLGGEMDVWLDAEVGDPEDYEYADHSVEPSDMPGVIPVLLKARLNSKATSREGEEVHQAVSVDTAGDVVSWLESWGIITKGSPTRLKVVRSR